MFLWLEHYVKSFLSFSFPYPVHFQTFSSRNNVCGSCRLIQAVCAMFLGCFFPMFLKMIFMVVILWRHFGFKNVLNCFQMRTLIVLFQFSSSAEFFDSNYMSNQVKALMMTGILHLSLHGLLLIKD